MKRLLFALTQFLPAAAFAAGLGVGTLDGSVSGPKGNEPVRGFIAVVDFHGGEVRPMASKADPARCPADGQLPRETTLDWQQRSHAVLAFNGGFWWMPDDQPVPECQPPVAPYKSGSFHTEAGQLAASPPVLALGHAAAPRISYVDAIDSAHFDVLIAGDWIRKNDHRTLHRPLLVDGSKIVSGDERAPRTAVGVNRRTGQLIVVMVEGRRADTQGLSLNELGRVMKACGADEAMNLDGGGSSTFSYAPEFERNLKERVKLVPLDQVCDRDALSADGLALAVRQRPLDAPLLSRPPGGKGSSTNGAGAGYRPILDSIGIGFAADRATRATDENMPRQND